MSDEYNPSELARDKRMRGDFAPIDAFEIARNNKEWYCPRCQAFVSAEAVTYEETHVVCGTTVTSDDTVITLAQENARLKAELAALKARRCETCRFRDERGWCEVNARTYPSDGFCSEWEAANA